MTTTYSELEINPENRIQWAFKGKREHVVKTNTPNTAYPEQTFDVDIPSGSIQHVIVPTSIPKVTFKLEIKSSKDKGRTIVNNIGREIVTKKVLTLGSKDIESINHCDKFDTFKDLYLTKDQREDRVLQGIQSVQGLKARVGATKSDGTAITFNGEETAIQKTLGNRFSIPLDFDFFNQPVFPAGLDEKLKVTLTLNSSERVIQASEDSEATFEISDIALEYDVIIDADYGEAMMHMYTQGVSIPYDKVTCVHYELLAKKDLTWKIDINGVSEQSLRGVLLLFIDETNHRKKFACSNESFYNPTIQQVLVSLNGYNHQLYPGGIKGRDLYPEFQKYFHKQNSDVTLGEYCTTKFGCWVDMRSSNDNKLHGSGRSVDRGLLLQIDKASETNGELTCYVFTISDHVVHIFENKLKAIE